MIEWNKEYRWLTIFYPRQNPGEDSVRIFLSDVRATKDIRVSYDFERDGWKIEMEKTADIDGSYFSVDENGNPCEDSVWSEVAFVPGWSLHTEEERA